MESSGTATVAELTMTYSEQSEQTSVTNSDLSTVTADTAVITNSQTQTR